MGVSFQPIDYKITIIGWNKNTRLFPHQRQWPNTYTVLLSLLSLRWIMRLMITFDYLWRAHATAINHDVRWLVRLVKHDYIINLNQLGYIIFMISDIPAFASLLRPASANCGPGAIRMCGGATKITSSHHHGGLLTSPSNQASHFSCCFDLLWMFSLSSVEQPETGFTTWNWI